MSNNNKSNKRKIMFNYKDRYLGDLRLLQADFSLFIQSQHDCLINSFGEERDLK